MFSKQDKQLNKWKNKAKIPVKILFIAESPPENEENYFYFDDGDVRKNSFSEKMFAALNIDEKNKKKALEQFISKGYFLIDAIQYPEFEEKKIKNKRRQIKKNITRIKEDIKELRPGKIIIIGKEMHDVLKDDIEELYHVRFPSRWNYKEMSDFQKELRKLI